MKTDTPPITIMHPSKYLDPGLVETLRQAVPAAEQSGRLHPGQLALIQQQRWFNLFVPANYRGLQLSLPEGLHLEESLAWTDGSIGWTVTLCSGANWFIGFLDRRLADLLFKNERVCLAGSGRVSGTATMIPGGYEISGFWKYASGSAHATAFTANCYIENDGTVLKDPAGMPLVRAFVFLREEITLHQDADFLGMVATSSNSFEVKQLKVAAERSFEINAGAENIPSPIYRYPFMQFAEATLAVNVSGMAVRFMDLCEKLFGDRDAAYSTPATKSAPTRLAYAVSQLAAARQSFYRAVHDSWSAVEKGEPVQQELLHQVSTQSRELASTARRLTDELYPYCGLIAASRHSAMNRVWRDLHTASQHSLLV